MCGARACVVAGHFLRGEGVEVTADALDLFGNFARGPLCRALEEHVLEEMEDAVLPARFLPTADAEPETDGNAFDMRHVRNGELGSVIETFLAEYHVLSFGSGTRIVKPAMHDINLITG